MITHPRPISSACIKCSSPPILWIKDEVLALSESEKFSLKIWNYRKCFVFSFSRSYSNFKLFLLAKPCCSKLLEYDEGRHHSLPCQKFDNNQIQILKVQITFSSNLFYLRYCVADHLVEPRIRASTCNVSHNPINPGRFGFLVSQLQFEVIGLGLSREAWSVILLFYQQCYVSSRWNFNFLFSNYTRPRARSTENSCSLVGVHDHVQRFWFSPCIQSCKRIGD